MRFSFALFILSNVAMTFASRPSIRTGVDFEGLKARFGAVDESSESRTPSDPYRIREVTSLPGFDGPLPTTTYAGYIQVTEAPARHLWFIFSLSEGNPAKDPVTLWLNGGPGCSSLDGFMYEHGPYNFDLSEDGDVTLTQNPFSWTKASSMIFLDSPATVGLSYTEDKDDVFRDDEQTATDSERFLRLFFTYFSEFARNDVFLSGESYAGVYIPNLALKVSEGNQRGAEPQIKLKGYLVGNGLTDWQYDGNATPLFAFGHALISPELYASLEHACGGMYWNATPGSACDKELVKMDIQLASLNLYDVLTSCYHSKDARARSSRDVQASTGPYSGFTVGRGWPLRAVVQPGQEVLNWAHYERGLGSVEVPCTDSRIGDAWLNDPEVRGALHARPVDEIGEWMICTDRIRYKHLTGSMIPVHMDLLGRGIRGLIYTGDHDMCIPWTGTYAWVRSLGLKMTEDQRPWYIGAKDDLQVAGYVRTYQGLTFATVKGAGHMVPQSRPEEALAMFSRFISGKRM